MKSRTALRILKRPFQRMRKFLGDLWDKISLDGLSSQCNLIAFFEEIQPDSFQELCQHIEEKQREGYRVQVTLLIPETERRTNDLGKQKVLKQLESLELLSGSWTDA